MCVAGDKLPSAVVFDLLLLFTIILVHLASQQLLTAAHAAEVALPNTQLQQFPALFQQQDES